MLGAEILFWTAIALVVYAHAGFPALVVAAGSIMRRGVRKAPITPSVTLIVAAYNEEDDIAARIENALELHYPRDQFEIVIASDGSTDATAEITRRYADRGVRLLDLPRRGKIHALNAAVREARGDILAFSDANSMWEPTSLRAMAENFADPRVGGVAGDTRYHVKAGSESTSKGENLFLRYDTWLKELESETGSVVSAQGGMYAIRRELYPFSEETAGTDDFLISTAVIEAGHRLVFEPGACSFEDAVPQASREFRRRVRLMTRGWRSLSLRRRLLNPFRHGFYSVVLFSHKALRRLVPVLLICMLLANTVLAFRTREMTWMIFASGQLGFYVVAASGWGLRRSNWKVSKLFYIPLFYTMANVAALAALLQFLRGRRIDLWQPQRHPNVVSNAPRV